MTDRERNGDDEDRGYDPGPEPEEVGDAREPAGYDPGPEPDPEATEEAEDGYDPGDLWEDD